MICFKKVFNLKISFLALFIAYLLLLSDVAYPASHPGFFLRIPVVKNTYARIVEIIERQIEEYPSNNKKPYFTIWVVCNQNRERSPIVASIINSNIPKNLKKYLKVESYGLKVKDDPYVDKVISRDSFLRRHVSLPIPYEKTDSVDIILVMTEEQKRTLIERGVPRNKVKLVLDNENLHIVYRENMTYDDFRKKIRVNIDAIMSPIFSAYSKKISSGLAYEFGEFKEINNGDLNDEFLTIKTLSQNL